VWCPRFRCVQIAHVGGQAEDPVIWADLFSKLKESMIQIFDARVSLYEDDVRKTDNQRQLPGWNFCTFFIQKVRSFVWIMGGRGFDLC
jgi:hypothetical protein